MRKSNLKTRLMAVLLTLCMALTLMPTTSFAEGTNEITTVDIGNVWKNLEAAKPVAFTAEVNPNNSECAGKIKITEEQWIPADDAVNASVIKSTDVNAPTPQAGVCYWYSVTLTALENYVFSDSFRNENDGLGSVHAIYDGTGFAFNGTDYMQKITVSDDKKMLTISTLFGVVAGGHSSEDDYVINNLVIVGSKVSYKVGETPRASATQAYAANYTFYEKWEEMQQTENGMEPVAFWYSDTEEMSKVSDDKKITVFEEGKTYLYSVVARTNDNYTFASGDNLEVTLDGVKISLVYVSDRGTFVEITGQFITPKMPIKKADIAGATLTFKAGDAVVFTAQKSGDNAEKFNIERETWFQNPKAGGFPEAVATNGSTAMQYFTNFQNGKEYQYCIELTPADGYYFAEDVTVTLNGRTTGFTTDVYYINDDFNGVTITSTELLKLQGSEKQNASDELLKPQGSEKQNASNVSLSATSYTYNGKVKKPSVTVKDDTGKKVSSAYYTVSYEKGCKNVGTYAVTVKFQGNYSGTVRKTFTIKPKSTSISKLTAGRKKFTVKWKKQATQTTGYQIQYSTSLKFKNAKAITVSKNKTTGKTVSKLEAKKYHVRIRTYKTVKAGGKSTKIYSSWSKAKIVKVK